LSTDLYFRRQLKIFDRIIANPEARAGYHPRTCATDEDALSRQLS
jgi:hypothetical protein